MRLCRKQIGTTLRDSTVHYVDYERLPIEEFSENSGSIPHNYEISFEIRQGESRACGDGELQGVKS